MASIGTLKSQFNRAYIYLNPNPYLGPSTWRLSNIPPLGAEPPEEDEIANLFTIPPIQHTETDGVANLFFSISSIPDNINRSSRSPFRSKTAAYNMNVYAPFQASTGTFSINSVSAIPPVETATNDDNVTIWFDIADLQPVEAARARRRFKTVFDVNYNSRSISALTADAPLAATPGPDITVSFDIHSLPEV